MISRRAVKVSFNSTISTTHTAIMLTNLSPEEKERIGETQILDNESTMENAEESGKIIGDYRVLKKLGQGGIGLVFKVQSLRDESIVALKILSPDVQQSKTAVERFIREARICQSFDHPRIIKVFQLGEHERLPYFTMEYIKGCMLTDYITKIGQLPARHALKIAGHVAQALAYAHERDTFHRDLKPSNILLERETHHVKVIDMGMAKIMLESDLTVANCPMGTPRYMAPEQIRNAKEIDALADIYSLGATLYNMLAGEPPYAEVDMPNRAMLLQHIYNHPPRPLREHRDLPASVIVIVEKAMARQKEDRFASADEMFTAIYRAVEECKG